MATPSRVAVDGSPGVLTGRSDSGVSVPVPTRSVSELSQGVPEGDRRLESIEGAKANPTNQPQARGQECAGKCLVSEIEDNEDDFPTTNASGDIDGGTDGIALKSTTSAATTDDGEISAPAEIPLEECDEDASKRNGNSGEIPPTEENDDSDYEYDYEDEGDTSFSGFLIPAPHLPAAPQQQPRHMQVEESQPIAASAPSLYSQPDRIEEDEEEEGDDEPLRPPPSSSSFAAPVASTSESAPTRKKWKEPSQQAVSMSLRAGNEKTGGKRRLAADLYKIMAGDTTEAGFEIETRDENSMNKWTVRLFGFDEDSNLHQDMVALGLDHIELEMIFPEQYPFAPPFVRVVRPRFKRQTGFVMNGALCMELLTTEGWNPVNDIESVIVSIRSLLVVGDGRLQAAVDMSETRRKAAIATAKLQKQESKKTSRDKDPEHNIDDLSSEGRANKRQRRNTSGKASNAAVGHYTTTEAKAAYSHLSEYHKKKGWDSSGWWAKKG